jgi:hypothetical protein
MTKPSCPWCRIYCDDCKRIFGDLNDSRHRRAIAGFLVVAAFATLWFTIIAAFLTLCDSAQAQQPQFRQPRLDANYLTLLERQQLVFERARQESDARQYRVNARRQTCGPRVRWYVGSDGFAIEMSP